MQNSNKKQIINSILIFIVALIWGTAFVAQAEGGNYIGGFTFTALRNYIGTIVLIPVAVVVEGYTKKRENQISGESGKNAEGSQGSVEEIQKAHMIGPFTKAEVLGGIICGTALMAASNFQQIGIAYTTVAKAGFLTAFYVILVPIFGVFLGHKFRPYLAACIALSVGGMYLLCLAGKEEFALSSGDILEIFCAVLFAVQILGVSYFAGRCRVIILSMLQFLVSAIESTILALIFDTISVDLIVQALPYLLYVGIFSSGVAYTLQIIGEKDLNPTIATLIMSLESVISAISGWILLGQAMSTYEILGALLMFVSILIAQIYPILKPEKDGL